MVHQSETGVPGSHQSRTWSEAGPPQSPDEAQAGQVYRRLSQTCNYSGYSAEEILRNKISDCHQLYIG